MAAITPIKAPLVDVKAAARRQTHVDLQQPPEAFHAVTPRAQVGQIRSQTKGGKRAEPLLIRVNISHQTSDLPWFPADAPPPT